MASDDMQYLDWDKRQEDVRKMLNDPEFDCCVTQFQVRPVTLHPALPCPALL